MPSKIKVVITRKKRDHQRISLARVAEKLKERLLPVAQAHWAATIDAFLYELYFSSDTNAFLRHNFSGSMSAFYGSLYQRIYLQKYWPEVSGLTKPHEQQVRALFDTIKATRTGDKNGQHRYYPFWPKDFEAPFNITKLWYHQAITRFRRIGASHVGRTQRFTQVTFDQAGTFSMQALMPEHKLGIAGAAGVSKTKLAANDWTRLGRKPQTFGQFDRPLKAAKAHFYNRLPKQQFRNAIHSVLRAQTKFTLEG